MLLKAVYHIIYHVILCHIISRNSLDCLKVVHTYIALLLGDYAYVYAPFLSLAHLYGTIYLLTLPPHRLCRHLSND